MARKSKKKRKAGVVLFVFCCCALYGYYLIGKVQMDFIIRQNEVLTRDRDNLKKEVGYLQVKIEEKKKYQRIVRLAKAQGLVFVPAARIKELSVNVKGLSPVEMRGPSLAYAEFTPVESLVKSVPKLTK